MYHKTVASNLSNAQRRHIVGMVDGPKPYVEAIDASERKTRLSLFNLRLIRLCTEAGHAVGVGAKFYCMTEDGRAVLCFVLAEYAEALIRAQEAEFVAIKEPLTVPAEDSGAKGTRRHAPPPAQDFLLARLREFATA